jgi:hypothetical protein
MAAAREPFISVQDRRNNYIFLMQKKNDIPAGSEITWGSTIGFGVLKKRRCRWELLSATGAVVVLFCLLMMTELPGFFSVPYHYLMQSIIHMIPR